MLRLRLPDCKGNHADRRSNQVKSKKKKKVWMPASNPRRHFTPDTAVKYFPEIKKSPADSKAFLYFKHLKAILCRQNVS